MKKLIFLLLGILILITLTNSINAATVGMGLSINRLSTYNCYINQDCEDSNPFTNDICVNPGTPESYCNPEPSNCVLINGSIININDKKATETSYKNLSIINQCNTNVSLFISGTDFYDSSSSGTMCPTTNQFTLYNFAYYANNGDYSTQNDPRADNNGYIPIQYGIPYSLSGELYPIILNNQSNILSNQEEMLATIKVNIPEPCIGNFDTGAIFITAVNSENYSQNYSIMIHPNINVQTMLNSSLISNVSLIRSQNSSDYNSTYLFEGDKIIFDILVYFSGGANKIFEPYVTIGNIPQPGNDVKSECIPYEYLIFSSDGFNRLSTTTKYNCVLDIESPENISGNYIIGSEVTDLDFLHISYIPLGNYYINPIIICSSDSDCNDNNQYTVDFCINSRTPQSFCNHTQIICLTNNDCNDNNNRTVDSCINAGTIQSSCKNENIACFSDSECGESKFIQNLFCSNGNVNQNYLQFQCLNPGTPQSSCKNETLPRLVESCTFGCNNAACIKDITPPEALISFDSNIKDIKVQGIDNLDKNVSVKLKETCKKIGALKNCDREYTLSDSSNNTLKIKLNLKNNNNQILDYNIKSFTYNNEKVMQQKFNYYHATVLKTGINQNIYFLGNFMSIADYNAKKNKTEIKIFTTGKPKSYTKAGLSLVGLSTNKGTLNYIV